MRLLARQGPQEALSGHASLPACPPEWPSSALVALYRQDNLARALAIGNELLHFGGLLQREAVFGRRGNPAVE